MFFDLNKAAEGDWFPFFESEVDMKTGEISYFDPKPDAGKFCIRSMSPFYEERRKSLKKNHQMVLNPTTRQMERVSYYPDMTAEEEAKESEDAWDYAITDWEGIYSAPNVEIPCNRENKLKMIRIPMFMRFVTRVFQILDNEAVKLKESQEKN